MSRILLNKLFLVCNDDPRKLNFDHRILIKNHLTNKKANKIEEKSFPNLGTPSSSPLTQMPKSVKEIIVKAKKTIERRKRGEVNLFFNGVIRGEHTRDLIFVFGIEAAFGVTHDVCRRKCSAACFCPRV